MQIVQKGGEGSAQEIKKSTIQNVDFLTRGRGGNIFIFPTNSNADFNPVCHGLLEPDRFMGGVIVPGLYSTHHFNDF